MGLTVAAEDYARDQIPRLKKYVEANQTSEQEVWKNYTNKFLSENSELHGAPFDGDQGWLKFYMETSLTMLNSFQESDDHAAVVQTSCRSKVPRAVEETLGLVP